MSEEITASAETGSIAEPEKRPVFLTVICILSFIAAGFGILGYITAITAMGAASSMGGLENIEGMGAIVSAVPSTGMTWAYIIVGFLTTIVALLGVLKMWQLKRQGFMIYAGATVVSVIMGIIYSGFGASIFGIVIGGGFIVMYFLNLQHMTE